MTQEVRGSDVNLCIDLGVGLGGASAAFKDAGWNVVGVDIERKFKPTVCASYAHLPFRTDLNPAVMIAAPDCSCFSMASVYRHWKDKKPISERAKRAIADTLSLKEEILRVSPDYALLENPHPGMMCHVLGKPLHRIRQSDYGSKFKKPTGIWEFGRKRLRWKWLEFQGNWMKAPRGSRTGTQGTGASILLKEHHGQSAFTTNTTDASARAYWPYGLSKAVLEAVESSAQRSDSASEETA